MDIFTCYVGQGALGVVRNQGEAVIVDSLVSGSVREQQAIEKTLDMLTRGHSVLGFILTGFDCDHSCSDGVDLILGKYQPKWIMYPKYYKDSDVASSVFTLIRKHEGKRERSARPLERLSVRLDRVEACKLLGLSSSFEFELFSPHMQDMDCSNNCSIVLKLTGFGESGFSYLLTGDTENSRWERINKIFGARLRSDVLAAPHHGSRNSINGETLLLIQPDTVLISAGVDNQYGHPDSQSVRAYSRVAKQVFATNVEGGVSLFTKKNGRGFETELVHQVKVAASNA